MQNVVHLVLGALGLILATAAPLARTFLGSVGVVLLALGVYGLLIDLDQAENFLSFNEAVNWLHLALGLVMVGLAWLARRSEYHDPSSDPTMDIDEPA